MADGTRRGSRRGWPGNVRQLVKVLRRSVYLELPLSQVIDRERELGALVVVEGDDAGQRGLWPLAAKDIRPMRKLRPGEPDSMAPSGRRPNPLRLELSLEVEGCAECLVLAGRQAGGHKVGYLNRHSLVETASAARLLDSAGGPRSTVAAPTFRTERQPC
jgi:hypothetical protein